MKFFKEQKNYVILFLFSYLVTCIVRPPQIGDALIAIVLTVLFGFKLYIDSKTVIDLNSVYATQLKELSIDVNNLKMTAMKGETKKAKEVPHFGAWGGKTND